MKVIVILAAILAITAAASNPRLIQQQWNSFKATYEKSYLNVGEESKRLAIFKDNLAKIDAHNALYKQGLSTYKMGVNKFADLTSEEFMAYINSSIIPKLPTPKKNLIVPKSAKADNLDWRNQGIVTPVKDQGQCGSCWSFSSTGALEGQYALKNGQLISLSEQNLVDCSRPYGTLGCGGGWMDDAFKYVRDVGINTEEQYPYEAVDGACRYSEPSALDVTDIIDFASGNDNLKAAVETYGPVAVAFDATNNLQFYSGGLFTDDSCDPTVFNHAVLIVGFAPDHWLVKNSWGDWWGENGYVRFSNSGQSCGLTDVASVPVLG